MMGFLSINTFVTNLVRDGADVVVVAELGAFDLCEDPIDHSVDDRFLVGVAPVIPPK